MGYTALHSFQFPAVFSEVQCNFLPPNGYLISLSV